MDALSKLTRLTLVSRLGSRLFRKNGIRWTLINTGTAASRNLWSIGVERKLANLQSQLFHLAVVPSGWNTAIPVITWTKIAGRGGDCPRPSWLARTVLLHPPIFRFYFGFLPSWSRDKIAKFINEHYGTGKINKQRLGNSEINNWMKIGIKIGSLLSPIL